MDHSWGGSPLRHFDGGATRDDDDGKLDFEGALSPLVLVAFAAYMDRHRDTADGRRDADNWQAGFPRDVLMKSLLRHVMDLWLLHRGHQVVRPEDGHVVEWDDALGGVLFNAQAMWHQRLTG